MELAFETESHNSVSSLDKEVIYHTFAICSTLIPTLKNATKPTKKPVS